MLTASNFIWNSSFQDLKYHLAEELNSPYIHTIKKLSERRTIIINDDFSDESLKKFLKEFEIRNDYQNIFINTGENDYLLDKEKYKLFIDKIKKWSQLDLEYKDFLNLFERYLTSCLVIIESIEPSETANRVALKINDIFNISEHVKKLKNIFNREIVNFEKAYKHSTFSLYLSIVSLILLIIFCSYYFESLLFYKNYKNETNKQVIIDLQKDNNFKKYIKNEIDRIIAENTEISKMNELKKESKQKEIFKPINTDPRPVRPVSKPVWSDPRPVRPAPDIKKNIRPDPRPVRHVPEPRPIQPDTITITKEKESKGDLKLLLEKFGQMENKISKLEEENNQMKDIFATQENNTQQAIEKQKLMNKELKNLKKSIAE